MSPLIYIYLKYEHIHYDEMTDTSTHYKQMEDLVSPEIFMPAVKYWKFQCVNNSANGVDDTTC